VQRQSCEDGGMHSFDDFGLDAALRTGLAALNFAQPTPIQSAALPFALWRAAI
jgi:superfamily II DNA/RNA helicase